MQELFDIFKEIVPKFNTKCIKRDNQGYVSLINTISQITRVRNCNVRRFLLRKKCPYHSFVNVEELCRLIVHWPWKKIQPVVTKCKNFLHHYVTTRFMNIPQIIHEQSDLLERVMEKHLQDEMELQDRYQQQINQLSVEFEEEKKILASRHVQGVRLILQELEQKRREFNASWVIEEPIESNQRSSNVCTVCLERIAFGEIVFKLDCCHKFHRKCLEIWCGKNSNCPNCRVAILRLPIILNK